MTYQLPPKNISKLSYHDYHLESIRLNDDEVKIDVRHPENGSKSKIVLSRVEILIVNKLMLGNIIESIDCHNIDEEIKSTLIDQISDLSCDYVGKDKIDAMDRSAGLIGKKYVTINPTYGAELYAICGAANDFPAD